MAVGNPLAPGGLLPALGVAPSDDHNLIDLDSDTYFDFEACAVRRRAARPGRDKGPGPPGAAWTQSAPRIRDVTGWPP